MQIATLIADQEFTFFTWRGSVRAVRSFGRTSRTCEILIQARNGTRRSITVQPRIRIEAGHEVSLVYLRRSGFNNGALVGVLDHTSDQHCAIPQGYVPIRLRPSPFVDLMKGIERYSLPGTALLLTMFAAVCLFCVGVTYSVLTWLMIGSVATTLLWAFNVLADWHSEAADHALIASTEEMLDHLAAVERIANGPEPYDSYGATWVLAGRKDSTQAPERSPGRWGVQTEPYEPRSSYRAV
ncbi:hypothetical protein [Microvirga sp. VF16]|uniref:hypothetical protein n=1 Tax=Microvirga sp. VF16 TaxID=2807101 RepID=UPI001FEEB3D1|nr:hypothetical protein [Microvirga sp. VF16]